MRFLKSSPIVFASLGLILGASTYTLNAMAMHDENKHIKIEQTGDSNKKANINITVDGKEFAFKVDGKKVNMNETTSHSSDSKNVSITMDDKEFTIVADGETISFSGLGLAGLKALANLEQLKDLKNLQGLSVLSELEELEELDNKDGSNKAFAFSMNIDTDAKGETKELASLEKLEALKSLEGLKGLEGFEALAGLKELSKLEELEQLNSSDGSSKVFAFSMNADSDENDTDKVVISGLGSLSSEQKDSIVAAFREAGINKIITFSDKQEKRLVIKKDVDNKEDGSKVIVIKMETDGEEPKILKKEIIR